MKIAIDATAVPRNPAGAGIYTQCLINALASDDNHEVFAFVGRNPPVLHSSVIQKPVRVKSRPARLAYQEFRLGRQASRSGAQVFHGPHYEIPRFLKTPSVVTFHDPTFWTHPQLHEAAKRAWFNRAWSRASERAARVIVPSAYSAAFVAHDVDPDRIDIIAHAPSPACSALPNDADDALRSKGGVVEPYVLWIGTIEPRKALATLVEAFAAAVNRGLDHRLVIVGGRGWKTTGFDKALTDAGDVAERIVHLGYVSEEAKAALLRGADVFVYPSIEEGFGIPVLEAMACGTPVITTEATAMEEIAGDCALYVPALDATSLSDVLVYLLDHKPVRESLSARALMRASEFTWAKTASEHVKTYEQLLA